MRNRLNELAELINDLSYKVDSGRFKYYEKQELDRLVKEYLELEDKCCARCKGNRDDHCTSCSKCRKEME